MDYVAAILAGGESSRFGADKAMADLGGAPLIAHVRNALGGAAHLAVVGHPAAAAFLGAITLSDSPHAVRGPLAGVLAAMEWAQGLAAEWLVTAPCDAPLIPGDMATRLVETARSANAPAAFASTTGGLHPLCAAWRPSLAERLHRAFQSGTHPAVRDLAPGAAHVTFPDEGAFLNVNTPADMQQALARLTRG